MNESHAATFFPKNGKTRHSRTLDEQIFILGSRTCQAAFCEITLLVPQVISESRFWTFAFCTPPLEFGNGLRIVWRGTVSARPYELHRHGID